MSYYLFKPNATEIASAGYHAIKNVPSIFSSDWSYCHEASRYLREKAQAEFVLEGFTGRLRLPTPRSLEGYGQCLCNFLEWCEATGRDWTSMTYMDDVLDGYQSDMLRGRWSVNGRALSAKTVNLRVAVAIEFLKWAALRGLRAHFEVRTTSKQVRRGTHKNSSGYVEKTVMQRLGAVRPSPRQLRTPTDAEIAKWRHAIEVRRGKTQLLMVDLILGTGIRREEAAQWRRDTLPLSKAEWNVRGDFVTVELKYGTKGGKYEGADGEEVGPARNIDIPIGLAERMHEYALTVRPALCAKFVRAAGNTAERRRRMNLLRKPLFLTDATGTPITGETLYEAWTGSGALPFKGWSIHAGRHYWACKTLMERAGQVWRAGGPANDLRTSAMDVILLHIQPQLGHVSTDTTMLYLTWLERMFVGSEVYEQYAQALDEVIGD